MVWERLRMLLAWPFLVIGTPFIWASAKVGGTGVRWVIADMCEQILEDGNEKRPRPYWPAPDEARDRRASTETSREIQPEYVYAEEAFNSETTPF